MQGHFDITISARNGPQGAYWWHLIGTAVLFLMGSYLFFFLGGGWEDQEIVIEVQWRKRYGCEGMGNGASFSVMLGLHKFMVWIIGGEAWS